MALKLLPFTQEAAGTGTGDFALAGAVASFFAFSANLSDGDTTYYVAYNATDRETGIGTYTASGNTLARTTILNSTNGGSAVNFTTAPNVAGDAPEQLLSSFAGLSADQTFIGSNTFTQAILAQTTGGYLLKASSASSDTGIFYEQPGGVDQLDIIIDGTGVISFTGSAINFHQAISTGNQIVSTISPGQYLIAVEGGDHGIYYTSYGLSFPNDKLGIKNINPAYDLDVTGSLHTTSDALIGGALQLGNAYVATPQVCSGYVTLQDSTGTPYKVLVAA